MQREADFEAGVERLKRGRVFLFVDRIEPHALGPAVSVQHGGVVRGIDGAKTRGKRADTLLAIHLQVEDVNNERIAGLRTIYIKRTRKGIVAFNEGHAVAGLLQGIAEAVERIGLQNAARFESRDRRRNPENILNVIDRGAVLNHFLFCRSRGRLTEGRKRQSESENKQTNAHVSPPKMRRRSASHYESGVNPPSFHLRSIHPSAILSRKA